MKMQTSNPPGELCLWQVRKKLGERGREVRMNECFLTGFSEQSPSRLPNFGETWQKEYSCNPSVVLAIS